MGDFQEDQHWVGFDLGGTKMLAKVFDSNLKSISQHRVKTKGYEGAQAGVARIIKTINGALEKAEIKKSELTGIGIGCPGPLDLDNGVILNAPNLGWSNVKIKKELEDEFGCPVTVMNDVDAGVYGEYRRGAAKGARTVLGVFPGTGIGGGCVYEGEIIRGKTGSCMEIGHLQVDPNGPFCGCGRQGCLEAVASRLVIASRAAAAAYRGQAPHLMKNAGTDLAEIRSKALSDSIAAGDIAVETIIRESAKYIGRAVGGVVNLLSPDVIVLGGGLVEAMTDLFVEEVTAAAKAQAMPSLSETFEVVDAKLGDDAGVIGAAAWARHRASGT